jgi:hypothetical protein
VQLCAREQPDTLNLKRPREGSPFPWHQDRPSWYVRTPEHAHEVATAMLAVAGNGALRVLLSCQPAGRPRQERLPWRPHRVHELP